MFSGAKAPEPRLAFGSAGGALGVALFGEVWPAPRGTIALVALWAQLRDSRRRPACIGGVQRHGNILAAPPNHREIVIMP